jgi:hypothetical protein
VCVRARARVCVYKRARAHTHTHSRINNASLWRPYQWRKQTIAMRLPEILGRVVGGHGAEPAVQGWGVGGDVGREEAQIHVFASCTLPRDKGFGGEEEEGGRVEGVAGGQPQCVGGGGGADSFVSFWTDTGSDKGEDDEEDACSDEMIAVRQRWLRERRDARQVVDRVDARQVVDRVDLGHTCSAATECGGGERTWERGQLGEREGGQRGERECRGERDCIASSKHLDRHVFSEVSVQCICVVNSNYTSCMYNIQALCSTW